MCGRFGLIADKDDIEALFALLELEGFPPRYNIAPTQPIAVVRFAGGKRQFALLRWGLLPPWVKDPRDFALLINARGESVLEKPAFRNAMRRRRCLIPADGFYEWKSGQGGKQAYYIRSRAGGPMAFAGLWEVWTGPNGEELETVAIVTTTANRQLAPLHARMPVIIQPDAFDVWLDGANDDTKAAAALIAPAPESLVEVHPVSDTVNRTANDSPTLIEPVAERPVKAEAAIAPKPVKRAKAEAKKDTRQASLF
jgi:putative SOS response-associated peptidase YedK